MTQTESLETHLIYLSFACAGYIFIFFILVLQNEMYFYVLNWRIARANYERALELILALLC